MEQKRGLGNAIGRFQKLVTQALGAIYNLIWTIIIVDNLWKKIIKPALQPHLPHEPVARENASDKAVGIYSLSSIGILAVLAATVTYVGFITPPGGPDPYWATCDYSFFSVYWGVNGAAFISAVAAVLVVTAVPLFTPRDFKGWSIVAISIGGICLTASVILLVISFFAAGLVSNFEGAPSKTCAWIPCVQGGINCQNTYKYSEQTCYLGCDANNHEKSVANMTFVMDANTVSLNFPNWGAQFENQGQGAYCFSFFREGLVNDGFFDYYPSAAGLLTWAPPEVVVQKSNTTANYTICAPSSWTAEDVWHAFFPAHNVSDILNDLEDFSESLCSHSYALNDASNDNRTFCKCYSDLEYFCVRTSFLNITHTSLCWQPIRSPQLPIDFPFSSHLSTTFNFSSDYYPAFDFSKGPYAVSKLGQPLEISTIFEGGGYVWDLDAAPVQSAQIKMANKVLLGVAVSLGVVIVLSCMWAWNIAGLVNWPKWPGCQRRNPQATQAGNAQ